MRAERSWQIDHSFQKRNLSPVRVPNTPKTHAASTKPLTHQPPSLNLVTPKPKKYRPR